MRYNIISFFIPVFLLFCTVFSFAQYSIPRKDTASTYFRIFEPFIMTEPSTTFRILPHFEKKPFFCALEDRIEKRSAVPFRFRLGSLDYVNILENKK